MRMQSMSLCKEVTDPDEKKLQELVHFMGVEEDEILEETKKFFESKSSFSFWTPSSKFSFSHSRQYSFTEKEVTLYIYIEY